MSSPRSPSSLVEKSRTLTRSKGRLTASSSLTTPRRAKICSRTSSPPHRTIIRVRHSSTSAPLQRPRSGPSTHSNSLLHQKRRNLLWLLHRPKMQLAFRGCSFLLASFKRLLSKEKPAVVVKQLSTSSLGNSLFKIKNRPQPEQPLPLLRILCRNAHSCSNDRDSTCMMHRLRRSSITSSCSSSNSRLISSKRQRLSPLQATQAQTP